MGNGCIDRYQLCSGYIRFRGVYCVCKGDCVYVVRFVQYRTTNIAQYYKLGSLFHRLWVLSSKTRSRIEHLLEVCGTVCAHLSRIWAWPVALLAPRKLCKILCHSLHVRSFGRPSTRYTLSQTHSHRVADSSLYIQHSDKGTPTTHSDNTTPTPHTASIHTQTHPAQYGNTPNIYRLL